MEPVTAGINMYRFLISNSKHVYKEQAEYNNSLPDAAISYYKNEIRVQSMRVKKRPPTVYTWI